MPKLFRWKVTGRHREDVEMKDWDTISNQLHAMYEGRRAGSVVLFEIETVLDWYIDAEKAVRELCGGKPAEDRQENVRSRD